MIKFLQPFQKSNYFLFGITVKIILLFFFSSEHNSVLFKPFVDSFFKNGLINPWQFYFENDLDLNSFPYHSLMLFILTPFAILSNILSFDVVFKIPLLIADLIILNVLVKSFPVKEKAVYLFYFLNPIILYAIYIHSQLDIIPTAFLFYAIYLLLKNKYNSSSLIFGLAMSTKIHVIVALPLIFFYLYKVEKTKVALKYLIISLSILLIFDLPFIFSDGFIQMVILNPKQSLLINSIFSVGLSNIILPIAAILLIYLHFFNQDKVNEDLLYFYFGVLFIIILLFVSSGAAWYVWIVPFVSIYFIKNDNKKSKILYISFSVFYLIFFVFFSKSDYSEILFLGNEVNLKIDNQTLSDIFFTAIEVILVSLIYVSYKYGIKSNSIYRKNQNLVIGIGGDSGVGKTTLLIKLKDILGNKLLEIEGDGEHKWERGNENWDNYTHLDPKANYIHKQSESIIMLKNNKSIFRSDYNHGNGKFTEQKKVNPKEYIVISGLHPFYLPKLRKNIDLKVYLDTDENLRKHWKIIRDKKKRGYLVKNALKEIKKRIDDAKKHIYPQKEFADIIIKYYPLESFSLGEEDEKIKLGLKITFDANIHAENIFNNLNCEFEWDYNKDLKSQYIKIENEPEMDFKELAIRSIENINEIISYDAKWRNGYEGLCQIILLKMISEKYKKFN